MNLHALKYFIALAGSVLLQIASVDGAGHGRYYITVLIHHDFVRTNRNLEVVDINPVHTAPVTIIGR